MDFHKLCANESLFDAGTDRNWRPSQMTGGPDFETLHALIPFCNIRLID